MSPSGPPWRRAPASVFLATLGGVGFLPLAPGTWGTAAALPLVVALSWLPFPVRLLAWLAFFPLACLASDRAGRALDEHDSPHIVVDEAVGIWITLLWFDDVGLALALTGFLLFRIADTLKDPASRWIDRHVTNGFGVVADDVTAGLIAAGLLIFLHA